MTIKVNSKKYVTNVIPFNNYIKKKQNKPMSSTIAAIIAVKVDHPENMDPEDYLVECLEKNQSIEILAFEDALDTMENFTPSQNINNFINDA